MLEELERVSMFFLYVGVGNQIRTLNFMFLSWDGRRAFSIYQTRSFTAGGSGPGGPATSTEWLYHFSNATHVTSGMI